MVGDFDTGKTQLLRRYVHGVFSTKFQRTIVDFCLKELPWLDSRVFLQIWDIGGTIKFVANFRRYYRETSGAFVVFDSTQPRSFLSVLEWKKSIDDCVQMPDGSPIPIILIMNNCDRPKHPEIPDTEELRAFAAEHGFADFYETTARDPQHQVLPSISAFSLFQC